MELYIRVRTIGKTGIKNYGEEIITGKEGLDGKTKNYKRNDIRVKSE